MSLFSIRDPGSNRPLEVCRGAEVIGEISNDYRRGWTFHTRQQFYIVGDAELVELHRLVNDRIALMHITDRLLS